MYLVLVSIAGPAGVHAKGATLETLPPNVDWLDCGFVREMTEDEYEKDDSETVDAPKPKTKKKTTKRTTKKTTKK